jgi:hypothetical protein
MTPEYANKYGHCLDQVAAVARALRGQKKLNWANLQAEGINHQTILRHFGTWNCFHETFGWDGKPGTYSRPDAIAALQALAQSLGRTPCDRDLRGYHPDRGVYRRLFGSLAAAQAAAGLPVLARRPVPESERLSVLATYAATVDVGMTGRLLAITRSRAEYILGSLGWPGQSDPHRREWAAEMAQRLAGEAA